MLQNDSMVCHKNASRVYRTSIRKFLTKPHFYKKMGAKTFFPAHEKTGRSAPLNSKAVYCPNSV
jgi:hypothetical protein